MEPNPIVTSALWTAPGAAAFLASYLLGAVPFGLLIARAKGVDLRRVGSGNIGATNTSRALGRGWGFLAFGLDFGKGWVPVGAFAVWAAPDDPILAVACGLAAVLGHCFPVYLRFRGGKGVATACGAMAALDPLVCALGGLVWVVALYGVRFVGVASMAMGATYPIAAYALHPERPAVYLGAVLFAVLIVLRHHSNIARILAGTEPRAGAQ